VKSKKTLHGGLTMHKRRIGTHMELLAARPKQENLRRRLTATGPPAELPFCQRN
jgi:hypothetical protein